jgi:hypothetical protein
MNTTTTSPNSKPVPEPTAAPRPIEFQHVLLSPEARRAVTVMTCDSPITPARLLEDALNLYATIFEKIILTSPPNTLPCIPPRNEFPLKIPTTTMDAIHHNLERRSFFFFRFSGAPQTFKIFSDTYQRAKDLAEYMRTFAIEHSADTLSVLSDAINIYNIVIKWCPRPEGVIHLCGKKDFPIQLQSPIFLSPRVSSHAQPQANYHI